VIRLLMLMLLLAAGAAQAAKPFDPFSSTAIEPKLGAKLPTGGEFLDHAGRQVTLADYLGKVPVLVAPVDYGCVNICGVTLAGLFAALDQMDLEPGAYQVLAASMDPRDGVAQARDERAKSLARFGRKGAGEIVHFLVGEGGASHTLLEALGFEYAYDPAIDQYAHSAAVAVLTPDGRLARWLYGYPFAPSDIRLALVEAGGGAIGTLADRVWLLCYGYDPKTGTYSALIGRILEAGGGATVLVLGGLIAGLLWRERRTR
jgi:protein SCO1